MPVKRKSRGPEKWDARSVAAASYSLPNSELAVGGPGGCPGPESPKAAQCLARAPAGFVEPSGGVRPVALHHRLGLLEGHHSLADGLAELGGHGLLGVPAERHVRGLGPGVGLGDRAAELDRNPEVERVAGLSEDAVLRRHRLHQLQDCRAGRLVLVHPGRVADLAQASRRADDSRRALGVREDTTRVEGADLRG